MITFGGARPLRLNGPSMTHGGAGSSPVFGKDEAVRAAPMPEPSANVEIPRALLESLVRIDPTSFGYPDWLIARSAVRELLADGRTDG